MFISLPINPRFPSHATSLIYLEKDISTIVESLFSYFHTIMNWVTTLDLLHDYFQENLLPNRLCP